MVPQDASLFHRSLLENIRYGVPKANESDVRRACEDAHCLDFIAAMPDGLNTIAGDRGTRLSGGQRQTNRHCTRHPRAIRRFFCSTNNSSLDSASEAAIQLALERLMQNRTVVAIAHRLSTLQTFDRILVINRGRVT